MKCCLLNLFQMHIVRTLHCILSASPISFRRGTDKDEPSFLSPVAMIPAIYQLHAGLRKWMNAISPSGVMVFAFIWRGIGNIYTFVCEYVCFSMHIYVYVLVFIVYILMHVYAYIYTYVMTHWSVSLEGDSVQSKSWMLCEKKNLWNFLIDELLNV